MVSDIAIAILILEEQCFPNSEGKGQSYYPFKREVLKDLTKLISHVLFLRNFCMCFTRERKQRGRNKERGR